MVLDIHMPGRTGLEVVKAIRALEATGHAGRMPIIMLTAAASTDLREDSLDAGVDLFLSKPVEPRALLRGVNQVFSQTGGSSEARTITAESQGEVEYIDRGLLKEMADLANDSQFIPTLTAKFADNARQLVDAIEAAVARKDYEQFQALTHALKGAAMMAGALRLRDSAARAERITHLDFAHAAMDVVDGLKGTLELTNQELSRLVA